MRFKILRGKHAQKVDGKTVVYKAGEVIDSKVDLVAKFNSPNAVKFERVDDAAKPGPAAAVAAPTPQAPKDAKELHAMIDRMGLAELKQMAEDDEVDLKGETDINKIRKLLKAI